MNGESLLNVLQQKLVAHPDYAQLTHKLKCDVQTHPTRDEQRTIISALSKYDKENKLITTVQQCLMSLGNHNTNAAASEALVALIKKDRSTVFVLHQFLNQPLPRDLRGALYTTLLGETSVGEAYSDALRDKPYSTQSPQESIIKEKVKSCVQTTPGFNNSKFLRSNIGHRLMIKALSYWHLHVGRPLTDTDYRLCIPIISLSWEDDGPASVGHVLALLAGLTKLMQTLKATDATTLNIVLQYVQQAQPELSEHLMLLRADGAAQHAAPAAQLVCVLHEKLFVGYLGEQVIRFLLDQCVIGRDVPSYNPLFSFTATVLCLCASAIAQCNSVSSALSLVEQRGLTLPLRHLQQFIQTHYIDSLATQLSTKPSRVHFSNKTETLGQQEKRIDTEDRRLLSEVEDLKKKLAEEKKQRNDRQIAHRNEMGILRAENEDLKRRVKSLKTDPVQAAVPVPVPIPATVSTPTPPAPPPAESIPREETPDPLMEPEPEEDNGDISGPLEAPLTQKQVQNLWLEVAKSVMQRVKRLAFKSLQRKQELDTLTFFLNKQYEEDRALAEVELFGAEIPAVSWDGMDETEYFEKIFEIDSLVEKYARDRLTGSSGPPPQVKKK